MLDAGSSQSGHNRSWSETTTRRLSGTSSCQLLATGYSAIASTRGNSPGRSRSSVAAAGHARWSCRMERIDGMLQQDHERRVPRPRWWNARGSGRYYLRNHSDESRSAIGIISIMMIIWALYRQTGIHVPCPLASRASIFPLGVSSQIGRTCLAIHGVPTPSLNATGPPRPAPMPDKEPKGRLSRTHLEDEPGTWTTDAASGADSVSPESSIRFAFRGRPSPDRRAIFRSLTGFWILTQVFPHAADLGLVWCGPPLRLEKSFSSRSLDPAMFLDQFTSSPSSSSPAQEGRATEWLISGA